MALLHVIKFPKGKKMFVLSGAEPVTGEAFVGFLSDSETQTLIIDVDDDFKVVESDFSESNDTKAERRRLLYDDGKK